MSDTATPVDNGVDVTFLLGGWADLELRAAALVVPRTRRLCGLGGRARDESGGAGAGAGTGRQRLGRIAEQEQAVLAELGE